MNQESRIRNQGKKDFFSFMIQSPLRGFTLIELLIVIAVIGILSGGILTVINIGGNIKKANLAKVETFDASIQNALGFDLVGEWTFDDGTAKDTSGYGNDGTVTGATLTQDRKKIDNKAYNFIPSNGSRIEIGDKSIFEFGNGTKDKPFTLSAWINLNDVNTTYAIISKINTDGREWNLDIHSPGNGQLRFFIWDHDQPTNNYAIANINNMKVFIGVWVHVVASYDGRGGNLAHEGMELYINGTSVEGEVGKAIGNYQAMEPSSTKVWIGINGNGGGNFNGKIDDVRIYKSALLSSQVRELYARGLVKRYLAYR